MVPTYPELRPEVDGDRRPFILNLVPLGLWLWRRSKAKRVKLAAKIRRAVKK